jgi:hypothetical protein
MQLSELVKLFLNSLKGGLATAANHVKGTAEATADLVMNAVTKHRIIFKNTYRFECFDALGNLKWVEEVNNQVMTVGVNDLLTQYFKGSAYTAAFYVGLVDNASVGPSISQPTRWLPMLDGLRAQLTRTQRVQL